MNIHIGTVYLKKNEKNMRVEKENNSIKEKWGSNSSALGWVAIPTLLLFSQKELGITSSELNVLLNVIAHWWEKSKYPFPSQGAIAYRSGLSLKTVQRALNGLEAKGLIIKEHTARSNSITKGRNIYDLSPLIDELDKVSPRVLGNMMLRKKMVVHDAY